MQVSYKIVQQGKLQGCCRGKEIMAGETAIEEGE
jgi:hypothetical protein